MRRVVGYIGLGSNLGDREEHLREALRALARAGVAIDAVSSLWETEPVGGAGPEWFLNMTARIETGRTPEELLDVLLEIERARGRRRARRNAPRPLDLDLLLLGGLARASEGLTLPHPRMWERRFVLAPLAELAPGLLCEATGRTAAEQLQGLDDRHTVRHVGTLDWTESAPLYSAAP